MPVVFRLPVLLLMQINLKEGIGYIRKFVFIVISVFAALIIAGGSYAQQPNPLDTVPEKMPFDIPYGTAISLERADAALTAAVAEAKKRDWKLICAGGGTLAPTSCRSSVWTEPRSPRSRSPSTRPRASAKFRRETKVFESGIHLSNFNYMITLDDVIASRGGIPLVEGGELIGAIGCSGGTGSQDEVVAKAGAAVIK